MHDKVVGMTTYEYDKWIEAWRLLKLFFTLIMDYVIEWSQLKSCALDFILLVSCHILKLSFYWHKKLKMSK